jgi:adenylate cyclase
MDIEIERKFLVGTDGWRTSAVRTRHVRQAYLCTTGPSSIRVRLVDEDRAVLTIKSAEAGLSRREFEYAIPSGDAQTLFTLREGEIVEKLRHDVPYGGFTWEVDVFLGANQCLVVAEIELERADQDFDRPDWLGEEITHDHRYYNAELARYPFSAWR